MSVTYPPVRLVQPVNIITDSPPLSPVSTHRDRSSLCTTTFHSSRSRPTPTIPVLYCIACSKLILENDFWLPSGCPIVHKETLDRPCSLSNGPIHVECWEQDHLIKHDCVSLDSWLLGPEETKRMKCYHWNCKSEDDMKIRQCKIQGSPSTCKFLVDAKQHEYVHVMCWLERHVYVCESFMKLYKKGVTSKDVP
jgi:hypothetical protein